MPYLGLNYAGHKGMRALPSRCPAGYFIYYILLGAIAQAVFAVNAGECREARGEVGICKKGAGPARFSAGLKKIENEPRGRAEENRK